MSWIEKCLDPNLSAANAYGQHLGDFTDDGYPDVATARPLVELLVEPNSPDPNCFILATTCLGVPAQGDVETIIWADIDGDLDLDLFLPAYESTPSDPNGSFSGNRLLLNLGADPNNGCPTGVWTLDTDPNIAINAHLQSYGPNLPAGYRDPEGCQVADHDRDGDGDLFFSQRVWQNNAATADDPNFARLDTNVTGVSMFGAKEEGTLLSDLDLDGDLDLVQVSVSGSAKQFLSRGDGEFFVGLSLTGNGYGVSAADWDNDGDIDLTVGGSFWRNRFIETAGVYTGTSMCWVQIYNLDDTPYGVISHALPSWLDADRDGDLDCARGAWGPGAPGIRFERNRLYHGGPCATCEPKKRYVNVRPVRAALRDNLLHFGLPRDPDPNDPNEDLRFDVYVDFLTRGNENWRVDWTVNEQLADVPPAQLYADCNDVNTWGRPITVYRDGRVRFKGADPNQAPSDPNIARLDTLGGPLALPDQGSPLPDPNTGNVFAGVRFNTEPDSVEM
ncbi:MAG TPA: FG-GAP-like repeat-containing protein, partial [Phycisphaerae bacterium]|nr:FG-GAP-like repeat-containing protein [Phycisphaerae bacterium]